MAPLRDRLMLAQIEDAESRAALPSILPGDIELVDETRVLPAALDADGNRTGEDDVVVGDLIEVTNQTAYGPGGVATPRSVRRVVKTADQRIAEAEQRAANLEATKALAVQRNMGRNSPEYLQLVSAYNTATDSGDAELAALYKKRIDRVTASPGILAPGTHYRRRVEQLAADAGVPLDMAEELQKTETGMGALVAAAARNKALSSGNPTAALLPVQLTSQQNDALRSASENSARRADQTTVDDLLDGIISGAPNALSLPRSSPVVIRTKAERDALPPGTLYIGPDGNQYTKK